MDQERRTRMKTDVPVYIGQLHTGRTSRLYKPMGYVEYNYKESRKGRKIWFQIFIEC